MNIQAALVKSILQRWQSYEWTSQGFGFIRTKIQDVGRIHIWDSAVAVQYASTMHTHPWPLTSTIISGELINCRFTEAGGRIIPFRIQGLDYVHSKLQTGEGGGLIGEQTLVKLFNKQPEYYLAGDTYTQIPTEIHRTIAQDGTVTLMERPQGPPLEVADVYWPQGLSWVSAEPKSLESWHIQPIINHALARWNTCETN